MSNLPISGSRATDPIFVRRSKAGESVAVAAQTLFDRLQARRKSYLDGSTTEGRDVI